MLILETQRGGASQKDPMTHMSATHVPAPLIPKTSGAILRYGGRSGLAACACFPLV